jgi:hypothetical protein
MGHADFVRYPGSGSGVGYLARRTVAEPVDLAFPVRHEPLGLSCRGKLLQCKHSMWSLFKEFLKFARQEKKWWLVPLVVFLLLLGAILVFTAGSGIAWALYPFF